MTKESKAQETALGNEIANVLKKEEFILALKTEDQLIVGQSITKNERKAIIERVKAERKGSKKTAKKKKEVHDELWF